MEYILKIKPYHRMNRASAIADHNSYSCFNDLHRFDPATMTWALLSPRGSPPSPRYGFGFAAAGDGALYAFGGAGYFVGEARNRAKFGRAQSRKIRRTPLDDRMPPSCRRSGPQAVHPGGAVGRAALAGRIAAWSQKKLRAGPLTPCPQLQGASGGQHTGRQPAHKCPAGRTLLACRPAGRLDAE